MKNVFRLFGGEKGLHLILPRQVQFPMGPENQVVISLPLQLPHDGAAHHPPVAGHVDFRVLVHRHNGLFLFAHLVLNLSLT